MNLVEMIVNDEEIYRLKIEYKELSGKNAPPFVIGKDYDIDSYKEKLRKMVKKNLK